MTLLLGATSLDVTPPPGHRLDGYAARTSPAVGTADPLCVTMIWLSTEDDPGVLWLSLDAIAAGTALTAELAAAASVATGIPADRVLVCASHTHSGPSGWSGAIHPVIPADREPSLYKPLIAAVESASLPRRPVTASWHSADIAGVGTNRYRANGPHDNTAGALALRRYDGTLAAVLLDYACHPTTYGPENLLYSPDFPATTRTALKTLTPPPTGPSVSGFSGEGPVVSPSGEGPVVGYLQGAAGDVSPRFTRQGRDAAEVRRLGGLLAAPIIASLAEDGLAVPAEAPRIRRTTVRLPVRALPPTEEIAATIEAAGQAVSHHCAAGAEAPAARIAQTRLDGARGQSAMRNAGLPEAYDLPVSVVTLGNIAWIHLPVEPFATHGLHLQAESPYPITRVVGYTDGYFGYLVDPAAHTAGTYEALISFFDPPTTTHLLTTTLTLLTPH
ncbi:hypothetical protein OG394_25420 [Kribbella sp. NBC_01245]|uniref:hypothetical protein n=1 Tax=Kribbella sp. NBC_01245 TaxID=2903578 RepID=UPI002E2A25DC|nr:hypothetical protein [Kribbella sp. NBC_01245]